MFDDVKGQQGESPEAEQANWQGWTPPWMSREGEGPHGPFGPGRGPGFGFGGPRGWGWRGPRGSFGPGFAFGWRHQGWHGPHGHFGPGHHWGMPDELLALRSEAAEVARLFAIASRGAFENKERLSQLRAFLDRSRKELSDMIYSGSGSAQGSEGQASSGGSSEVGQA